MIYLRPEARIVYLVDADSKDWTNLGEMGLAFNEIFILLLAMFRLDVKN